MYIIDEPRGDPVTNEYSGLDVKNTFKYDYLSMGGDANKQNNNGIGNVPKVAVYDNKAVDEAPPSEQDEAPSGEQIYELLDETRMAPDGAEYVNPAYENTHDDVITNTHGNVNANISHDVTPNKQDDMGRAVNDVTREITNRLLAGELNNQKAEQHDSHRRGNVTMTSQDLMVDVPVSRGASPHNSGNSRDYVNDGGNPRDYVNDLTTEDGYLKPI